jgi:hypothetical protein
LEWLGLENNKIAASLSQIVARIQLPNLKFLDLNMNQVEWDENGPEFDDSQ